MAYLCFIKCIYWVQIISWISYLRQIFYGIMSHIPDIILFSYISCISLIYLRFLRYIWGIFEVYLRCFQTNLRNILGIKLFYLRHISNIKQYLMHGRGLPKPKYFGRNQEPTRKWVSVPVPGLAILEIIGYWLNQEFLVKTGK